MKETIIKGTGNSRTLGSVPNLLTLYPTYEAFAAALAAGEVPVDIGPLNPAGVAQMGDALNKQTLLKDSTAALFGLPNTAVPNDILAAIRPLITEAHNVTRIISGTYAGRYSGSGTVTPQTLNFGFRPKLFLCGTPNRFVSSPSGDQTGVFMIALSGKAYLYNKNSASIYPSIQFPYDSCEFLSNGIKLTDSILLLQTIYEYVAIG